MKVFCAILVVFIVNAGICHMLLEEKFIWRELEFSWPSDDVRQEAIRNGNYVRSNNLPLAFDVWRDKVFLTVPRWKTGVASTLSYVENSNEKSPILHPYPNFQMNQLPSDEDEKQQNNVNIISAFGIRVDECDRLWIVDSGVTNLLGGAKKYQNPSVLIFDLNNSSLIRRFEIPQNQIKPDSFFVNVFVDVHEAKCDETFAYIADIYGYGIIVYDYKREKSWRVNHNYFSFDPVHGDLNVAGINFQWHDGVFGMAMGKIHNEYGDRTLYFHALASTYEFIVENSVLKNESFSSNPSSAQYYAFSLLGSRGAAKTQSSSEVYDEHTNVIFYTQPNRNAIGCWNINKAYRSENQGLIASNDETLIFPNDLRIDSNGNLYILSNRMPIFMYSTLDSSEYNFRILVGKTSDVIKGTACAN